MSAPLYERIYKDLLQRITAGEFKKGDRVPSEKELSKQFNVSRITSKKALDTLAENRVIERIRGKGSYVLNEKPQLISEGKAHTSFMKKSETLAIGLILPDFSTNFGLNFVKQIEKKCSELDIHLLIKRSYGRVETEAKIIQAMIDLEVDGLLIIPVHGQHYNNTLLQLVLHEFPIVLADRFLKGIPASSVCINNSQASKELTKHLLTLDHKNIAYISPPLTGTSAIEERLQGYKISFSYQGLVLKPEYMLTNLKSSLPSSYHSNEYNKLLKEDYHKIEQFILHNPEVTAFVACEYELALMIYHVLQKMNKKIPEEYSIVCFDFPECTLSNVVFTHIKQDEKMLANKSMDLLVAQINGDDVPKEIFTDYQLIKGTTSKQNM